MSNNNRNNNNRNNNNNNNNKNNDNKGNNNKGNDNKGNDNKGNDNKGNNNNNHRSSSSSSSSSSRSGGSSAPTSANGGGGRTSQPSPAAANFASQYLAQQQQKNNSNKGNNNKPNNDNKGNNNNNRGSGSRNSVPLPGLPSLPGASNKPNNNGNGNRGNSGGGGNSNRGNSGSGNRSIEQFFGGGSLTEKEFEQAKAQHGGAAVKDWIRSNTSQDQLGGNLKERLQNRPSMQGYFGKGQDNGSGSDSSVDTGVDTSGGNQDLGNEGGGNDEGGTYDYAAEMEAMLAPLREQIDQLNSQLTEKEKGTTEAAQPNFTPDKAPMPSKDSYSYTPNTGGSGTNSKPDYYQNWLSDQESFNRASTAYLFSPGGTRREEEPDGANAAMDANHDSNGDWRNFWNPADGNEVQRAWATPAADGFNDEVNQRRARNRMAGDVFSDAQPTVR